MLRLKVIICSVFVLLFIIIPAQITTIPNNDTLYGKIDDYIQKEMKAACIPSLSIGILYQNNVVFQKGYSSGFSGSSPVTPKTPFVLGSISKSFTALAVMQLKDKGLLNIEDPVEKYVPWFSSILGPKSENIKVQNLLNHTSGIKKVCDNYILDYIEARKEYKYKLSIDRTNGIKMLQQSLAASTTGNYEYTNINYLILSDVIENVSNIPYAQYITKNIFTPLGMNHSYTSLEEAVNNGLVSCYRPFLGFPYRAEPMLVSYDESLSMGYLISCAEDMTHYLQMYGNKGEYGNNRIISAASMEQMLVPSAKLNYDGIYYGYGWFIDENNGYHYHQGETYDFHNLQYQQNDGWSMIILLNKVQVDIPSFSGIGSHLMTGVIDILNGNEPAKSGAFTISNFFTGLKAISLILVVAVIMSIILLISTGKRKRIGYNRKIGFFLSVFLLNVFFPLTIIAGFQIIVHASWYNIIRALPDFTAVLFGSSIVLIVTGISRIVIYIKKRKLYRQTPKDRDGARLQSTIK